MSLKNKKSGYISIVGKTNVGKSTLLNEILGQKVAITSRKPQTTRHRLLGIKTIADSQMIFIDTPGFHKGHKRALNQYMNKVASSAMKGVDVLIYVIEGLNWTEEDQELMSQIPEGYETSILVINKTDKIEQKEDLLPFIGSMSELNKFSDIIPLSALKKQNVSSLVDSILLKIPEGDHIYPSDQVVDVSERFLASEIIREKCITRVGDELPYRISVAIDKFKEEDKITHIDATLFVEKSSQKGMLIGSSGSKLKSIGTAARLELEEVLQTKIMLNLWVKVKSGWTDDEAMLSTMGYDLGKSS
ncbi:MAG: GTPase Era [Gammaproteobacteria bacterium]|jgi:GTP-binding protein Era|nr:MAG: GTPase Era [Gammaproteobacteria bacterium]